MANIILVQSNLNLKVRHTQHFLHIIYNIMSCVYQRSLKWQSTFFNYYICM